MVSDINKTDKKQGLFAKTMWAVYSAIFFVATVCRVLKLGKVADGAE